MSTYVKLPFSLPRSGYCGTEFYRLVPSPYKAHEALLEDGCGLRARYLALAVGGQEPWKKPGIRLSPVRCVKWLDLFNAGFAAAPSKAGWQFTLSGGQPVKLAEAVRTARAINGLPNP
jgi:hypothetical protein